MINVWIGAGTGICGLLGLFFVVRDIQGLPSDQVLRNMGQIIHKGALAYLKRQFKTMVPFLGALAILLGFFFGPLFAVFFLFGTFCSLLSGFTGMFIATSANHKTTYAAKTSVHHALYVAFSGGSVMGILTCSMGILGFTFLEWFTTISGLESSIHFLIAFSLGASFVALFARIGGGIFTKAADIGADIVGKIEARIPEDDPRNPAVIADNVGDNVGDVAGMGADLFESYVGAFYGCLAISLLTASKLPYPLFIFCISSLGFLSSLLLIIIGRKIIRRGKISPETFIRNIGLFASFLTIIGSALLSWYIFHGLSQFLAVLVGILCGILLGKITDYYTSLKPVLNIAKHSQSGSATNILAGLSTGMESTFLSVLVIGLSIWLAFASLGLLGIALAGLGMLLTLSSTISIDAYGPISDNAGGIAELTHQAAYVRENTDVLDAIGNTTAAIGKGFSIGSAALTALTLFNTFSINTPTADLSLTNPKLLSGLLLGAMLPFFFSSQALTAVSKTAHQMVEEVRRQFKEIVGIMRGEALADYEKCIDIATIGALKGMILPSLTGILSPFLVFFTLGLEALAGLIAGTLISGVCMAIFMSNTGGAWDNAKKYIESGKFGGKGSPAHHASITGDTVGDPLKDTAGPSLNILIKLISIISLVFIPLFLP
jgi:K(+)-stimulated pyrophosphate-energized sodium pump